MGKTDAICKAICGREYFTAVVPSPSECMENRSGIRKLRTIKDPDQERDFIKIMKSRRLEKAKSEIK